MNKTKGKACLSKGLLLEKLVQLHYVTLFTCKSLYWVKSKRIGTCVYTIKLISNI